MQIRDFTQTEADYLETVCNFTPDENRLFHLRLRFFCFTTYDIYCRPVSLRPGRAVPAGSHASGREER